MDDDAIPIWWYKPRYAVALGLLVAVTFATYLLAYIVLSRRGYAEADLYGMKGFYYFTPEDTDAWRRKNLTCIYLFKPLNAIDRALGFGRSPGYPPMFALQ